MRYGQIAQNRFEESGLGFQRGWGIADLEIIFVHTIARPYDGCQVVVLCMVAIWADSSYYLVGKESYML